MTSILGQSTLRAKIDYFCRGARPEKTQFCGQMIPLKARKRLFDMFAQTFACTAKFFVKNKVFICFWERSEKSRQNFRKIRTCLNMNNFSHFDFSLIEFGIWVRFSDYIAENYWLNPQIISNASTFCGSGVTIKMLAFFESQTVWKRVFTLGCF